MSESKETERWQGQERKNRLLKMTETQARVQIFVATYIYSALARYQIKEKKAETSQVYKERWNMKKWDVAKLFDNREAQVC